MEEPVSPVNTGSTRAWRKCQACRMQKVKCLPIFRDFPQKKCERCQKHSLPCGPNLSCKEAQEAQISAATASQGASQEEYAYNMLDLTSPSSQQANELPMRHYHPTNPLNQYLEPGIGSEPLCQPPERFPGSCSIPCPNPTLGTNMMSPGVESCRTTIFERDGYEGQLQRRLRDLDLNTEFVLYVKPTLEFLQKSGLQGQDPYGTLHLLQMSIENNIAANILEIQALADEADRKGKSVQAEIAYRRVADALDYLDNPGRYNANSFWMKLALFYQRRNDKIQAERIFRRLSNLPSTASERQDYCRLVATSFVEASSEISKSLECLNLEGTTLNLETPCPPFQRALQHQMPEDVLDAISEISDLPDIIQRRNVHVAIEAGSDRQVANLLESISSANIDDRDAFSRTSLYVAAQLGQVSASLALIAKGADRSTRDARGHTTLEIAARGGSAHIVGALIGDGFGSGNVADVNCPVAYNGSTPLQAAAEEGHGEVVGILLEHGAFVSAIRQHDGKTAAQLARTGGHQYLADYLDRVSAEEVDPMLSDNNDLYLSD